MVDENDEVQSQDTLYFNAFTEDLFSWDNDLENDEHRTLKLNAASSFFVGLNELEIEKPYPPAAGPLRGLRLQDQLRVRRADWQHHQRRRDLLPQGTERRGGRRAVRRGGRHQDLAGEENIFIWCFFLAILQLALDGAEAYKWVEHVYIDDPDLVSR